MKYIIVIPSNHHQLGLFRDLEGRPDTEILVARPKKIRNVFLKLVQRVHNHHALNSIVRLPFRQIWDEKIRFKLDENGNYCIVYLDGSLLHLDRNYLDKVFRMENTRNVLVLINSLNAASLSMMEVKPMIGQFKWDAIYTFDPEDARTQNYRELGCCYYSMRDPAELLQKYPCETMNDVYFTGGLKGARDEMILSMFKKLDDAGLKADFHLMYWGKKRLQKKLYADKIHYFTDWMSYENVLAGVLRSKVIIEILQEGQNGPSLRYYEAVCYNKKLLSNNPHIVNFPYYDPCYMKHFSSLDDIDLEWIAEDTKVDYHYKGDFSPIHLLELVREKD